RNVAVHQGSGQLVFLIGPHAAFDVARDGEEEPVRVDLGGVDQQCLVAVLEVLGAFDPGGDLGRAVLHAAAPLEPVGIGRLQSGPDHRLVDRPDALLGEAVVVVHRGGVLSGAGGGGGPGRGGRAAGSTGGDERAAQV